MYLNDFKQHNSNSAFTCIQKHSGCLHLEKIENCASRGKLCFLNAFEHMQKQETLIWEIYRLNFLISPLTNVSFQVGTSAVSLKSFQGKVQGWGSQCHKSCVSVVRICFESNLITFFFLKIRDKFSTLKSFFYWSKIYNVKNKYYVFKVCPMLFTQTMPRQPEAELSADTLTSLSYSKIQFIW